MRSFVRWNQRQTGWAAVALVGLLFSAAASAQVYRCGSSYQSTPCGESRPATLRQAGSISRPTFPQQLPGIAPPPSYYAHLSGRCKELNDAIRTSNIRGVRGDTLSGLHKQWVQECALDEQLAMKEQGKENYEAQNQQLAAREAAEADKQRVVREKAHCEEMAAALANKQNKPNRSAGEQADLDHFKENYNARCVKH